MSLRLIDDRERVGEFCASRMSNRFWEPYTAIGLERDGEVIGGVVFDSYYGPNINAHIAGKEGTTWLTRRFLHAIFHYAFIQLGCIRMTGAVSSANAKSIRLVTHMGFVHEATMKQAVPEGDLLLFVMWKKDCRFLGGRYGKEIERTEGT